jgi:hypothetical protein
MSRGDVRRERNRRFQRSLQESLPLAVIGQQLLDKARKRSVALFCRLLCRGFQAGVDAQINLRSFHLSRHVWQISFESL